MRVPEHPESDCSSDRNVEESALTLNILERYRAVLRASRDKPPKLRFGRRTVAVSTIAQQFYCEKAVQFSFEHPLPPSRNMQDGTAGHEVVAALGVPMTHEQAVQQAIIERAVPLCVYEFRIGWEHDGVTVLGFVDEAWFRGGRVELVAERKFSNRPGIYLPYRIQAALYCLGLSEMGFSAEAAMYRISVLQRGCHACAELAAGDCPILTGKTEGTIRCEGRGISEVFHFDREQTVRNLDWALEFWRNEREAEPAASPGRCRACRYKNVCEAAQL